MWVLVALLFNGTRIKEIIDKLKYTSENIIYVKGKNFEIDKSIANNNDLLKKNYI